jgi:hypothetical protein
MFVLLIFCLRGVLARGSIAAAVIKYYAGMCPSFLTWALPDKL